MGELTSKQQKFVRLYMSGTALIDAYIEAYDVSPTAVRKAVQVNASKVLSSPRVAAEIKRLQAKVAKKVMITAESLVEELEEIKRIALSADNPQSAAAVSAVLGKAKLLGLDKNIIELSGKNGGPIEMRTNAIESITAAFMALKSK